MTAAVRNHAQDFLRRTLSEGPQPARRILALWKRRGHSARTLRSAAKDVGVVARGGPGSTWALPETLQIVDDSKWHTPEPLMGAVHGVLGTCELDPASPATPVHVRARRWFSKADDGLAQPWHVGDGWVWLNPPWGAGRGKPEIPAWVDKLLSEGVKRWLVLIPARQSKAHDRLEATGAARLFLDGRTLPFGGHAMGIRWNCILYVHGFDVDALRAAIAANGIKAQRLVD